jgi:hypothetical protein
VMIFPGLVLAPVPLDILRMILQLNVWLIVLIVTLTRLDLELVRRIVPKALIRMITQELVLPIVLSHHQPLLKKLITNVSKFVPQL